MTDERKRLAKLYGIPEDLADRIKGSTPEEQRIDAARLRDLLGPQAGIEYRDRAPLAHHDHDGNRAGTTPGQAAFVDFFSGKL